jgi:hypothetical protein
MSPAAAFKGAALVFVSYFALEFLTYLVYFLIYFGFFGGGEGKVVLAIRKG